MMRWFGHDPNDWCWAYGWPIDLRMALEAASRSELTDNPDLAQCWLAIARRERNREVDRDTCDDLDLGGEA